MLLSIKRLIILASPLEEIQPQEVLFLVVNAVVVASQKTGVLCIGFKH